MKKKIDFELYIIKATYLFMNKSTENREAQKQLGTIQQVRDRSVWEAPTSQIG